MTDTEWAELRRTAQDLSRAQRWAEYLDLIPQLREDTKFWSTFWGPVSAIAARNLGRPEARDLLAESIAAGFCQPEIFHPELGAAFGTDSDWPELLAAMAANVPAPPVELIEWPTMTPTAPMELFRLPGDRERLLRERIPAPAATAWATAQALLRWVTTRWVHNNAHVERPDAVELLDRVDAGERFACVEYSIVLSQALNASGIPSRRVILRKANHHTGIGGGHVVSEAWIDEIGRWVLLDGQNGLYWCGTDGTPLGLLELQGHHHAGGPRPGVVTMGEPMSEAELDVWWSYFASAFTTGAAWSSHGFAPYVDSMVYASPAMVRDPALAYPDLAEIAVSIAVMDGAAALQPHTAHPFATGFRITEDGEEWELSLTDPWPLRTSPSGEHQAELAVVTAYGQLRPSTVRYRLAPVS